MNTVSFSVVAEQAIEELLEAIEEIEEMDDCDLDLVDGVLTIEFEDGSQIIINRQEPVKQLWLASPFGPAHFDMADNGDRWTDDKTGEDLRHALARALSEKLGTPVSLD